MNKSTNPSLDQDKTAIEQLKEAIEQADAIVIGAGAGLSTAAGFTYSGPRFEKYFSDFEKKYGFDNMYEGGFYSYSTPEEFWAFWSRNNYINRYMNAPKPVYDELFELVKDKDYFVLTTNVDHCFQKAGFDKKRLFYTQGDYGLFQCSKPCHEETYNNEEIIQKMVKAQGFVIEKNGDLLLPEGIMPKMEIPSDLIPYCPHCHEPMSMNLRIDNTFVEDKGWHQAARRYHDFLQSHADQKVLYLELGVGPNTPGIIKYPFWSFTNSNLNAIYACLNMGEAFAPKEIQDRSICVNGDIGEIIKELF